MCETLMYIYIVETVFLFKMTSVLYFEKQSANLCGQHCLNNLMQSPKFSLDTLMTVAGQLDQDERKLLADDSDFASTNVSASKIIEKNIKKKNSNRR